MVNANDVAGLILARLGSWTDALKLQKLLYYTQAWHLAITDQPLFEEPVRAWKDGPVVREVWVARLDKATRRPWTQKVDDVVLDGAASDLIDLVIGKYGSMSGGELSALTHAESPWLDARGDLPPEAPSNVVISPDAMARYYRRHGLLDGRTAVDLAAGGIHVESADAVLDYDELLASLGEDLPDDTWGGANLHPAVPMPAVRRGISATDNRND